MSCRGREYTVWSKSSVTFPLTSSLDQPYRSSAPLFQKKILWFRSQAIMASWVRFRSSACLASLFDLPALIDFIVKRINCLLKSAVRSCTRSSSSSWAFSRASSARLRSVMSWAMIMLNLASPSASLMKETFMFTQMTLPSFRR